ncbi:AAA family ATPase [Pyruvatibacter mobilis]|uniref:AAA family ATPase n=1 Tax=Pyruvatibacter mobilis TaxID=1712261 RepID=UPI003BABAC5F
MLKGIDIKRFKSARELSLEFGYVNLFIGGNGTGKSNLLEAIGLSSLCLGRGLSDSDMGAKGLRITPSELIKSSFKNEDLPKTLELNAVFDERINYRVTLSSSERDPYLKIFSESSRFGSSKLFGRSHRGAKATGVTHADRLDKRRGIWDQIRATYDIPPAVEAEFSRFSQYVVYAPQTDFLRGRQAGRVEVPPIGLHGEGLPIAVSTFLRTWRKFRQQAHRRPKDFIAEWEIVRRCVELVWLPGWASSFNASRNRSILTSTDMVNREDAIVTFTDKFMHSKRNKLSVYDSSEGTLFLLFAAIILSHPDAARIFALDNVDNSLNPLLTRKLVEEIVRVTKLSNKYDTEIGARQVFLTSHNPTALDAFDLFDENCRVFVVRRNERGHTIVDRLQPPEGMNREDWHVAAAGRNLSQVWLDGDIKGALGEF